MSLSSGEVFSGSHRTLPPAGWRSPVADPCFHLRTESTSADAAEYEAAIGWARFFLYSEFLLAELLRARTASRKLDIESNCQGPQPFHRHN